MSLGAGYLPQIRREPVLTAFWRLNDPSGSTLADDYSARFNINGFYNGSPALGPALIQSDLSAASYLFGTGKSVSVGDNAALHILGDISLEAWIVPYAGSLTAQIIGKMNSGATFANPYSLSLTAGQVKFSQGNGTTQTSVTGTTAPPVSVPSHVVATSFRGAMTVYLNGAVVGTGTLGAQAVTDGGQTLYVGALSTGSSTFNGLLGEVALYSGALSARRVARHFTIGQQVLSDPGHYSTIDPPTFN